MQPCRLLPQRLAVERRLLGAKRSVGVRSTRLVGLSTRGAAFLPSEQGRRHLEEPAARLFHSLGVLL
jgi:hypothetical protein